MRYVISIFITMLCFSNAWGDDLCKGKKRHDFFSAYYPNEKTEGKCYQGSGGVSRNGMCDFQFLTQDEKTAAQMWRISGVRESWIVVVADKPLFSGWYGTMIGIGTTTIFDSRRGKMTVPLFKVTSFGRMPYKRMEE